MLDYMTDSFGGFTLFAEYRPRGFFNPERRSQNLTFKHIYKFQHDSAYKLSRLARAVKAKFPQRLSRLKRQPGRSKLPIKTGGEQLAPSFGSSWSKRWLRA